MLKFSYKAYDADRVFQAGELEAENLNAAHVVLQHLGLVPVELKPIDKTFAALVSERVERHKVGDKWASLFFRQLSTMLAVMNLRDALELMSTTNQDRTQRRILQSMLQDVTLGKTLDQALTKFGSIFSGTVIQLVVIGNQSGRLQEISAKLADQLEREYQSSKKIKSAMYYPIFVMAAAVLAIVILISTVLPTFAGFFSGQELPTLTRMVLSLGVFLSERFPLIVATVFGMILGAWWIYERSAAIRLMSDRLLLKIPFVGRLAQQTHWMNFFGSLSFLIESGVRLDRAVEMAASASGNSFLRAELKELRRKVESGGRFQSDLFPAECQGLITSGETSGTLPLMLERCEKLCAFEVEELSSQLPVKAEIAGTLMAGVIVALIVFSVMLPILSMGL
ncbi:MAG: type II secretion system F family protein [Selenomonadaceae bacterium]|nr:type II secretion system F family protein [Selenomonadaceae bacterium]